MADVKLSNLSSGVYEQSVKYAKEGTLMQNIDKVVSLAAKDGINNDEEKFLKGLTSEKNVQILKESKSGIKSLNFVGDESENIPKNENIKNQKTSDIVKNAISKISAISVAKILSPEFSHKELSPEEKNKYKLDDNIKMAKQFGKEGFDSLLKLPERERATFSYLYEKVDNSTKTDLLNLVKTNTNLLMSKDSINQSLLSNLYNMSYITKNYSTNEAVDGKNLIKEALNMLKDDKNILQGYHGTCGAGALENYMRDKAPSELIRIVSSLAENNKVTLADGKSKWSMKLPEKSLNYNEYGRNQFDRIFQSAVMQSVAMVGGDERSDYLKFDVFKRDYDVDKDDGSPQAVKTGDSAADPVLLKSLMNRMFKGSKSFEENSDYSISGKIKNLTEALKNKDFIACYKADGKNGDLFGSRHYVMVTGQGSEGGKNYVYFKNTADPDDNKMEMNEFIKRLEFTISEKK
ncbi:MAG: hypothetical protein U0457_05565 [Candidatus Sericytochromatia bacterium]